MRNGRRELDVAHALAANLGERHLDAALLADQALVLHALVLAAQALVVLDRSEDARAEEAVTLGLERTVVDRLGLLDLAERPRQDVVRARDRDLDLVERRDRSLRLEQVGDLVHPVSPFGAWPPPPYQAGEDLRAVLAKAGSRKAEPFISVVCAVSAPSDPGPRRPGVNSQAHSAAGGSCGCGSCLGASAGAAMAGPADISSSTLRPSARISLTSTLKLSGTPASKLSSPRTIAS